MRQQGTASELLANSRWNLIAFGFTIGAHFVIVPIVIAVVGLDAFGRAGLVIAAWAPLVLVGTVLGQATTRHMAVRLANGERVAASQVGSAAVTLCGAACAIGAASYVMIGPWVLAWLEPSPAEIARARVELLALAPGWIAQQVLLVLQGTASARQDFRTIAQISATSAVAMTVCTLGMVYQRPDAIGYLIGVSSGFVASALGASWFVRGSRTGLPWVWRGSRSQVPDLLHFGKWQVVAQLAGTIGNQIDRYVLATLAPPAVIGKFNAANRMQEAAYAGVVKAAEVLFPRFGAADALSSEERLSLLLRSGWIVMLFSSAVLTPMIVLAEPLMRLWVGSEVSAGGSLMLQTLVLGGLIGCGSNVITYYLMGTGQTGTIAVLSLIYSLLTIVMSIAILRAAGPSAAGAGLAVASGVRVLLALAWTKYRLFPDSRIADLLTGTALPITIAGGLSWALALQLPTTAIHSWWSLAATFIAASLVVSACVIGASCMTPFGRLMTYESRVWLAHRWVRP